MDFDKKSRLLHKTIHLCIFIMIYYFLPIYIQHNHMQKYFLFLVIFGKIELFSNTIKLREWIARRVKIKKFIDEPSSFYVRSCVAATSFIWHYRHLFKVSFLLMSEENCKALEEGCVNVLEFKLNMTLETVGTEILLLFCFTWCLP